MDYHNHLGLVLLDSNVTFHEKLHSSQRQPMIHLWVNQLQSYMCSLGRDLAFEIYPFFSSDFRDLTQK